VIEETGLIPIKIKNFNFSGKYKYKKRYPERPEFIGQTYSLYSTEVKKQNVSIDQREHSTYKWVSYAQAMKMLKHSNQKTCLKKVNDWLINKPE
jgi:isopentenyldiphosphate isomerase